MNTFPSGLGAQVPTIPKVENASAGRSKSRRLCGATADLWSLQARVALEHGQKVNKMLNRLMGLESCETFLFRLGTSTLSCVSSSARRCCQTRPGCCWRASRRSSAPSTRNLHRGSTCRCTCRGCRRIRRSTRPNHWWGYQRRCGRRGRRRCRP